MVFSSCFPLMFTGALSQASSLPGSLLCGLGDTHPVRCETRRGRIIVSRENTFGSECLPVRGRNKFGYLPVHSEPVIWQMWGRRRETTQQECGEAHLKDQFVQLCPLCLWVAEAQAFFSCADHAAGAAVCCRRKGQIVSLLPVWPLARSLLSGVSLEKCFPGRRLDSNLNGWSGPNEPAFSSSTVWWKAAHLSSSLIFFMFCLAASTVVPLPWNTSCDPAFDQRVVKGWCRWHGSALQLAAVTGHVWEIAHVSALCWPILQTTCFSASSQGFWNLSYNPWLLTGGFRIVFSFIAFQIVQRSYWNSCLAFRSVIKMSWNIHILHSFLFVARQADCCLPELLFPCRDPGDAG